ncbi:4-hydroxyphenylacetate decarboxylase activase [Azotosporobacter soli]|uniref:4-hydroxyphenylacetate decarboxylase activase n=1 Tax=Azotosporobacter soli TaxID=3055040 RepID=UPI0031FE6D62
MSDAAEENVSGIIFDMQSFSVHDGPGCRTTIFLKGCSHRCAWCANPESWHGKPELMFSAGKCRCASGCRRCLDSCALGAIRIREKMLALDWQRCRACENPVCVSACAYEALRVCGKTYSVKEVMQVLQRDRTYWGSGGGVTFSGGEPLQQAEFLTACLKRCRQAYIHTAIETTAHVARDVFLAVMEWVDFAFIDLKHSDTQAHRAGTGVDNALALGNIAALRQCAWPGRLVLRVPVIEGYNDGRENHRQIAAFMKRWDLFEINLLPFHRLGESKWTQLGRQYPYAEQKSMEEERLLALQDYYLERGIACYLGSETPF